MTLAAEGRGRRRPTCFIFISFSSHVEFQRAGGLRGRRNDLMGAQGGGEEEEERAVDSHFAARVPQQNGLTRK